MRTQRTSLVVLALLPVVALFLVGGRADGQGSTQPPATTTPDRPGIVIYDGKVDTPDPFLLDANGRYYLYFSTAIGASGIGIPMVEGRPGAWSRPREVLTSQPSWSLPVSRGGKDWAPFVAKFGSRYVLYYAPTVKKTGPVQHCLALATSQSPGGPFTSPPGQLVCDPGQGGDIDAQVFKDPSGPNGPAHPYYLIWKSDNNSTPGDGTTTIWAAGLSNDGLHLTSARIRIYAPDQSWQSSLIESPQAVLGPDGRVWLFYSAGGYFSSPSYAVGYASCVGPFGPCTDTTDQPILSSNAQGDGPGEETAFMGQDGSQWLLYNPWHTGIWYAPVRPVEAVRLGFGASGPYLAEAGSFPPP